MTKNLDWLDAFLIKQTECSLLESLARFTHDQPYDHFIEIDYTGANEDQFLVKYTVDTGTDSWDVPTEALRSIISAKLDSVDEVKAQLQDLYKDDITAYEYASSEVVTFGNSFMEYVTYQGDYTSLVTLKEHEELTEILREYLDESLVIEDDFTHKLRTTKLEVAIVLENDTAFNYDFPQNNGSDGFKSVYEGQLCDPEISKSGLIHLMSQQGISYTDVLEYKNPAAESIFDECSEVGTQYVMLTAFKELSLDDFINLIALKDSDVVEIDNSFTIGFFNPLMGGGSILGISLKRPVYFLKSQVSITLDGQYGYTRRQVYG